MAHLDDEEKSKLLDLANLSIASGVEGAKMPQVPDEYFQGKLADEGATFVTITIDDQLRGCIGSLQAHRPLAVDTIHNARAAALNDPRFPPLSEAELSRIKIKISVLTPAVPMQFSSEDDLLSQLQPGVDGLILSSRGHRGTFLPAVWRQLPKPVDFLRHLKLKAGLPENFWADDVRVDRYTTEEFG